MSAKKLIALGGLLVCTLIVQSKLSGRTPAALDWITSLEEIRIERNELLQFLHTLNGEAEELMDAARRLNRLAIADPKQAETGALVAMRSAEELYMDACRVMISLLRIEQELVWLQAELPMDAFELQSNCSVCWHSIQTVELQCDSLAGSLRYLMQMLQELRTLSGS